MLPSTPEWKSLVNHYNKNVSVQMRDLFTQDTERFTHFSLSASGIMLDYSKNRVTDETMHLLMNLAQSSGLVDKRAEMFNGSAINTTENRPVLHTALRNFSGKAVYVEGVDVMPQIQATLAKLEIFVNDISSGKKVGYTGKAFTDVISIGIGGSFLGPKIMSEALKPYQQSQLNVHFIANVDGCHIHDVLAKVNPETTLFITSSKTLTTQETLRNTLTARDWFVATASDEEVKHHFACVSSNVEAAQALGIDKDNIFPMWDWVGGRYSVWSAIGLPLALAIGFDHYREFLQGAFEMDEHFTQAPLEKNIPVILALLGIWYRNFHGAQSQVLLPYYHYLRGLPAYIQQLDMESNGKSISLDNKSMSYDTGPIIWGSEGTNGQHSFHQLIHQSKTPIPVDFLMPLFPFHKMGNHHDMLASNCFGQSQALMSGQSLQEVKAAMKKANCDVSEIQKLSTHKVMEGNKPSNTLLFETLTPKVLGSLIAMYEHKVFIQGVIWNVNSFDQWGVELGKSLGNKVLTKISDPSETLDMDGSTNALIKLYRSR
ncbi:glucose-6-phosphate isomerase [Colwellia hornerae]|uniref:Glucose-6-phosphate isomerase n=1 Tax=Colwellia hornerae TaxID=89402 RepID=A0A5C6Q5Z1_9GAMM|nr:glucose-6-phosphate isomerase [Colwellia hornerae]TWX59482.1 glucose-6-phosphate isomerase [Colwellia hornerae]TWX62852.1 glucose-6-phosphate isomerase [Colwellia hornerae]TWX64047.1 glucose-6-phosphate isomerase [Colwellia hornerae]